MKGSGSDIHTYGLAKWKRNSVSKYSVSTKTSE